MGGLAFKVCPRCGVRNAVRPGSTVVDDDFCVRCDPKPSGPGFDVQVHGLCEKDGSPALYYRLRIVNHESNEVLFSQEPLERDAARTLALKVSEDIVSFLESVGC